MSQQLVIVGSGETAQLAYEYFTVDSDYRVCAFAVGAKYLEEQSLFDLPVVALEELEYLYPTEQYEVFVALSSGKLNRDRTRLYQDMKDRGYKLASYVSSRAFVWRNVEIGDNCFILEDNTLQPFVHIGNNVTLWSGNHIGHRSVIEDHCFISSHCVISGFCTVGSSSFLGVNCTIINDISIGEDCFIGAQALVQKNVAERTVLQAASTEASRVTSHKLFRLRS